MRDSSVLRRAVVTAIAAVAAGAPPPVLSSGTACATTVRAVVLGAAKLGNAGLGNANLGKADQAEAARSILSELRHARIGATPMAGIVPPHNPSHNIWPPNPAFLLDCNGGSLDNSGQCISKTQAAITNARLTEPVGALDFSLPGFESLPEAEQLFAIADLERVARGLPPMVALTQQLDKVAADGADHDTDPTLSGPITGGGWWEAWGSNWAGGTINAIGSDYFWMYDDGYGSGNLDCTSPTARGCWGHRDNILGTFINPAFGCPDTQLIMGAADNPTAEAGRPSFAEILVGDCGPLPSDVVYTWTEAETVLGLAHQPPPVIVVGIAPTPDGNGYWVANSAGKVWNFGDAPNFGDLSSIHLNAPVIGIAADPAAKGFWLVGADGGIFTFGNAKFHGSTGSIHLNNPVVGMTSTASGNGYWMVAGDGGIFSFGDAKFRGSMASSHLNAPIVGMAADPATNGYWLVAGDGGIFSFNARFYGSEGSTPLATPVVSMEVAANATGYRLLTAGGAVYSLNAADYGSVTSQTAAMTAIAGDPATGGYWVVGANGYLGAFNAPSYGSA